MDRKMKERFTFLTPGDMGVAVGTESIEIGLDLLVGSLPPPDSGLVFIRASDELASLNLKITASCNALNEILGTYGTLEGYDSEDQLDVIYGIVEDAFSYLAEETELKENEEEWNELKGE